MSNGQETRKEIVDRALARAREVGLEGLSLGALADDMQMSRSGLFAHFKSKESLQLGVLQEATEQFVLEVVQPSLAKPRVESRSRTA